MLNTKIVLFILILGYFIIGLPYEETSQGYCPKSKPPPKQSEQTPPDQPPPVTVARPTLSVGLQPRLQSLRTPSGSLNGIVEPWEVWWTLNREKHLNFRQPIEWVSIKQTEGGTTSITKHQIYEDLFNILIKSIADKDFTLSWNAALALGRAGDPKAVPYLTKAYQESKQILVKNYSLIGLGWLRDNSAIDILKTAVLDKKEQEVARSHAAAALGYLSDPTVLGTFKGIINDKELKKYTDLIAAVAVAAGLTRDSAALPLLSGLLNSSERMDAKVRCYAALGMGRLGTEDAFKELKKAINNKDKSVRVSIAIALGMINGGTALPSGQTGGAAFDPAKIKDELFNLLNDKEPIVRSMAAVSLAQFVTKNKLSDTKAVSTALVKALKETRSTEGDGLIVLAMGILGDESAKEEFKGILENRKKRILLKGAVIIADGLIKNKEAVPMLINMLQKQPDDPMLAPYLILSLGMIGDERAVDVIQPLWDKVDKNVSSVAYTNMAVALSMLGKRKEVVAQLVKHCAKGQNDIMRQYALHTLGLLGDRESAKAFVEAYENENSDTIKTYAVTGIGFMMEKSPLPLVLEWTADNNTEVPTLIIDHLLPIPMP